jgi:hypothetical protein
MFASLSRTDRPVGLSKWKGQMQLYTFATLLARMDRVSTSDNLYRMSPFSGLEQVTTNITANILTPEGAPTDALG